MLHPAPQGASASMVRLALGSAAQLSTYSAIKEWMLAHSGARDGPLLHVGVSFASVVFGGAPAAPMIRVRVGVRVGVRVAVRIGVWIGVWVGSGFGS
eukprot:3285256-Prymnesium_polylepis.1